MQLLPATDNFRDQELLDDLGLALTQLGLADGRSSSSSKDGRHIFNLFVDTPLVRLQDLGAKPSVATVEHGSRGD